MHHRRRPQRGQYLLRLRGPDLRFVQQHPRKIMTLRAIAKNNPHIRLRESE
jgi:hypothetical protein